MSLRVRHRTGDQALVREINLSLILKRLSDHAALSRATLAELTGLNKSTVSSLVQELISMQLVREVGLSSSGIGRPSMLLELNPGAGAIVAAELGVDFLSAVCADFGGKVIWRKRESTRSLTSQQAILDRLLALVREAAGECAGCGLLGLALGAPGLADRATGTLLFAPNLKWENVPLHDILQAAFPTTPVFVDNEANMAALGETTFGAAQGYDEVLFISVGVGLGGAVVRGGQIVRGKTGFASEFGHMTMDPDGQPCNCGNRGCWETQVSQSALFRHIRSAPDGASGRLRALANGDLDQLSVPLVAQAGRDGDPAALGALDRVAHDLGVGVASLVNALNPGLVVLGGTLSLAAEFLLPVVQAELERRALPWNARATRVILAQHGVDACVMGGVATVIQSILLEPGNFTMPSV
jgi:glucokinase-like ROK family protein